MPRSTWTTGCGPDAQAEPRSARQGEVPVDNRRAAAFLLYLQMHENPTDLRAVLRDYARDMVLPALEIYTDGLMADSTMYDAFLAADDQGESHAS